MNGFQVDGQKIGNGAPAFMIAEVGINHGGDPQLLNNLIKAAADSGADAIKLQAYNTGEFLAASSAYFDVLRACELSESQVRQAMKQAAGLNVVMFASCFDESSATLLDDLGAPMFKIASGDLTHTPLLRHIAGFGKPMIISTGGATMDEIAVALDAVRSVSSDVPVALLHCVSNYPTEAKDVNLACMATMREEFGVPVGYSDHTLGTAVAVGAVALGADLIEKHFTIDRNMEGPDHALSSDPAEFGELVTAVRLVQASVGRTGKAPVEARDFIPQIRRSATSRMPISAGQVITKDMLSVKRPGTGIQPGEIEAVIGRRAARDLAPDTILVWEDIE